MSTETSATPLSRGRDFAPRRTRLLTVRRRIASHYQTSPERRSSLDRRRHGPLHTAIVAPATPLPASNESHPPCRVCSTHAARPKPVVSPSADDRLRRWAREPLIVVRRPPSADRCGPLPAQRRSPSPVHIRPLSCRHFAPRGAH